MNNWEPVIGLEIHLQLSTHSKLFSHSLTKFGADANSQANLVDLALPGTLPVLNQEAVHKAIMFGLAINAEINRYSVFERKNYFYPDLPKGYQTTQLKNPIVGSGIVEFTLEDGSEHQVRIHHAHLEEDAGKSIHEGFDDYSGIDLNRAGMPLLEIVTEPDLHSAAEAVAFAKKLHNIVTAAHISDGLLAQGSMRFDVNVSVKKRGDSQLGTRTETKNLNSFKFMEQAIEQEIERQIDQLEQGEAIVQQTRLYNGDTGYSRAMRTKENSQDYRYFPCPDLLPVMIDDQLIATLKAALPELPDHKKKRFIDEFKLSSIQAQRLANDATLADFFEAVINKGGVAQLAAHWLLGEVSGYLNHFALSIEDSPIKPQMLADLTLKIQDNTLSSKLAKQVLKLLWDQQGDSVHSLIQTHGLTQNNDQEQLQQIIDEVINNNNEQVIAYRSATPERQQKMIGFFVGQCMKLTKGKADPGTINKLLKQKL